MINIKGVAELGIISRDALDNLLVKYTDWDKLIF